MNKRLKQEDEKQKQELLWVRKKYALLDFILKVLVRVPAYYFHANVSATTQHTFECPHGRSKSCESNRPVPWSLLAKLRISKLLSFDDFGW